jgi:hypothetical protein
MGIEKALMATTRAAGERLAARVRSQFASGSDPYGRSWAALKPGTIKRKRGRGRVLVDSGALAGSVRFEAQGLSGRLTVGESARYHQDGTRYMPARKILPDQALPAAWAQDARSSLLDQATNVVGAVRDALKAAIGRAGTVR